MAAGKEPPGTGPAGFCQGRFAPFLGAGKSRPGAEAAPSSLGNADIWETRRFCAARREPRFAISLEWKLRLEALPPQGCLDGSPSPPVLQMVIASFKNELWEASGTTAPQILHLSAANNPIFPRNGEVLRQTPFFCHRNGNPTPNPGWDGFGPTAPSTAQLLLGLPQPWRLRAESQTLFSPQSSIQSSSHTSPGSAQPNPAEFAAWGFLVSSLLNLERKIHDGFRGGEGPIPILGPSPGSAKQEGQPGTRPNSPAL